MAGRQRRHTTRVEPMMTRSRTAQSVSPPDIATLERVSECETVQSNDEDSQVINEDIQSVLEEETSIQEPVIVQPNVSAPVINDAGLGSCIPLHSIDEVQRLYENNSNVLKMGYNSITGLQAVEWTPSGTIGSKLCWFENIRHRQRIGHAVARFNAQQNLIVSYNYATAAQGNAINAIRGEQAIILTRLRTAVVQDISHNGSKLVITEIEESPVCGERPQNRLRKHHLLLSIRLKLSGHRFCQITEIPRAPHISRNEYHAWLDKSPLLNDLKAASLTCFRNICKQYELVFLSRYIGDLRLMLQHSLSMTIDQKDFWRDIGNLPIGVLSEYIEHASFTNKSDRLIVIQRPSAYKPYVALETRSLPPVRYIVPFGKYLALNDYLRLMFYLIFKHYAKPHADHSVVNAVIIRRIRLIFPEIGRFLFESSVNYDESNLISGSGIFTEKVLLNSSAIHEIYRVAMAELANVTQYVIGVGAFAQPAFSARYTCLVIGPGTHWRFRFGNLIPYMVNPLCLSNHERTILSEMLRINSTVSAVNSQSLTINDISFDRSFIVKDWLFTASTKDGGIRPIVIEFTIMRMADKLACRFSTDLVVERLMPVQLGVGVSGGIKATVHAATS
ncbi:hypothetical protein GJ496_001444 [Pomphorhynchus laevis]|nr:hypothetical protein GJ496_001444 [Pomphorhynchus laevis]